MPFVHKLFPIKTEEWSSVLLFFSMQMAFSFGAVIARSVGFTLLVGNLGNDFLPFAFILVDLSVMVGSFVYVSVSKKNTNIDIIRWLMFILAVFSGVCWLLLQLQINWAFGVFFVGFFALHILSIIHFGNFTSSYFTTVQSKRVMPVIFAGIPVGGMLGGLSLVFLVKILTPSLLILVLIPTSLITFLVARKINNKLQVISAQAKQGFQKKTHWFSNLKESIYFITSSPLLRYMAVGTFLFVIASRILEFQYQGLIYPETFPDLSERAAFFGLYEIVANFVWLLFQLFLSSRILVKLGVGGSNIVHPFLVLLSSTGLLISFSLLPAIIAQFINQELRSAIRGPAHNLLFHAIPKAKWASIQAFLSGVIFPLATIVASSFLLFIKDEFSSQKLILILPIISFILAALGIFIAFKQWRFYEKGIVNLLSSKKTKTTDSIDLLSEIRFHLMSENTHQVAIALETVRQLKTPEFVPLVGECLVKTNNINIKQDCAKTLATLPSELSGLKYLLRCIHYETDPETLSILLKELAKFSDESVVNIATRFLKHPNASVFSSAVICLLSVSKQLDRASISNKINVRLSMKSVAQQLKCLAILGDLQDSNFEPFLLTAINDNNPEISYRAFDSWIKLNKNQPEKIKQKLIRCLKENEVNKFTVKKKVSAINALKTCNISDDISLILPLLLSPQSDISKSIKQLLLSQLVNLKVALIQALFNEKENLTIRQTCLNILWSEFSSKHKQQLRQSGELALLAFLKTRLNYLHYLSENKASGKTSLIAKLYSEQAENQLTWSLDCLSFLSLQGLPFSKSIKKALLSNNKALVGNALEAITNCQEKSLSHSIFYVFDNGIESQEKIIKSANDCLNVEIQIDASGSLKSSFSKEVLSLSN